MGVAGHLALILLLITSSQLPPQQQSAMLPRKERPVSILWLFSPILLPSGAPCTHLLMKAQDSSAAGRKYCQTQ